MDFSEATAEAIRALDEHWDGRGQPRGLRGAEIPLAARILCLAQTVEVFHADRGVGEACRVVAERGGQWFDPRLVDALAAFRADGAFWATLAEPDLSGVEPPDRVLIADENRLDGIASAFAGVIDAKSPWTQRHSNRACEIASSIAPLLGFEATALRDLGRAARFHDIGKLAISNRILDKPGPLTDAEFATVKEHPVLTKADSRASSGLQRARAARERPPRAAGRLRLPVGFNRQRADHGDAGARGHRRV